MEEIREVEAKLEAMVAYEEELEVKAEALKEVVKTAVKKVLILSVHLQFEFEDKVAHHTEEDKEAKQDLG